MSWLAEDDDEVRERPVVLRVLKRWRALIVLLPLVIALGVAAAIGARLLWADVPERVAPAPDVTCWDLTVVPESQCPVPSGVAGLRWVFPSFTPGRSDCTEVAREEPLPFEWRCRVVLDGEPIRLAYSARPSTEQALSSLRQRYTDEPESVADGERLVFRLPNRAEAGYMLAVAYERYPFVVTVTAATIGLRERALEQLLEFRPDDQVLARP